MGSWTLSGQNTYTGATTVNAGILIGQASANANGPFGTSTVPAAMTVAAGTLDLLGIAAATTTNVAAFTSTAGTLLVDGTAGSAVNTTTFQATSFVRGTQGVLTLVPVAGGSLGGSTNTANFTTINGAAFAPTAANTKGETITILNATAPILVNGIYAPWVVAQTNNTSTAGDFVTFQNISGTTNTMAGLGGTNGYTTTYGANNVVALTLPADVATPINTSPAYALKIDGQTLTINSGQSLLLGGEGGTLTLSSAIVSGSTTSFTVSPNNLATLMTQGGLAIGDAMFGTTISAINTVSGTITLTAAATGAASSGAVVNYGIGSNAASSAFGGAGLILDNGATISGGSIDFFRSQVAGSGLAQTNEGLIYVGGTGVGTISSVIVGNANNLPTRHRHDQVRRGHPGALGQQHLRRHDQHPAGHPAARGLQFGRDCQ